MQFLSRSFGVLRAATGDMGSHLVFVYGTLKRGEPNHYLLQQSDKGCCEFVSTAVTVDRWPLVVSPNYFSTPYMLAKAGTGEHVRGEIFRLDDDMLKEFDRIERHPVYYERDGIQVRRVGDRGNIIGEPEEVHAYYMKRYQPCLLELKYLDNYASKDHPVYVQPADRDPSVSEELRKKYILRS